MDAEPSYFEAVIVPHRSLSRRGLFLLIGAICGLSMITSTEITLAVLLLRWNVRAARANEVILLSPSLLRVIRTAANGARSEVRLAPGWLRVELQERPGRVPGLFLASHGERVEVGASLGEPEKLSLADGLRAALDAWRHPRFENPQLEG